MDKEQLWAPKRQIFPEVVVKGDNAFLQDYPLFPKTQAIIEVNPEGSARGTGGGTSLNWVYHVNLWLDKQWDPPIIEGQGATLWWLSKSIQLGNPIFHTNQLPKWLQIDYPLSKSDSKEAWLKQAWDAHRNKLEAVTTFESLKEFMDFWKMYIYMELSVPLSHSLNGTDILIV